MHNVISYLDVVLLGLEKKYSEIEKDLGLSPTHSSFRDQSHEKFGDELFVMFYNACISINRILSIDPCDADDNKIVKAFDNVADPYHYLTNLVRTETYLIHAKDQLNHVIVECSELADPDKTLSGVQYHKSIDEAFRLCAQAVTVLISNREALGFIEHDCELKANDVPCEKVGKFYSDVLIPLSKNEANNPELLYDPYILLLDDLGRFIEKEIESVDKIVCSSLDTFMNSLQSRMKEILPDTDKANTLNDRVFGILRDCLPKKISELVNENSYCWPLEPIELNISLNTGALATVVPPKRNRSIEHPKFLKIDVQPA